MPQRRKVKSCITQRKLIKIKSCRKEKSRLADLNWPDPNQRQIRHISTSLFKKNEKVPHRHHQKKGLNLAAAARASMKSASSAMKYSKRRTWRICSNVRMRTVTSILCIACASKN